MGQHIGLWSELTCAHLKRRRVFPSDIKQLDAHSAGAAAIIHTGNRKKMCEGFPTCNKDRYGYYAPASTVGQGGNSFTPKIKIPPVNEKWIFEGILTTSKWMFGWSKC